MRSQKKREFLSLRHFEGMPVVEYQARFLTLVRFAMRFFLLERVLAAQFVSTLHISLKSIVATFSCLTLA